MNNEWEAVDLFEKKVAEYTGAPYAVAVDSCTNALFLSLMYMKNKGFDPDSVELPLRTYISVPQSVMNAGYKVRFRDFEWLESRGMYNLGSSTVIDAAKRLTHDMYRPGSLTCLSCHSKKPIPIGKGGLILTDDKHAVEWLKKARYEGRTAGVPYKENDISMLGWNMYMTPDQAIRGIQLLDIVPEGGVVLDEPGGYPDLSKYSLFRNCEIVK